METYTSDEMREAFALVNWSESTCGKRAKQDATIALLFDEPTLHPARAEVGRKLCGACPILSDCLSYTLQWETPTNDNPQQYHSDMLIGGFSLSERRGLLKLPQWRQAFGVAP